MNFKRTILLVITIIIGLVLTCCNQRHDEGMIALINVNLIPMTSNRVIEDQTVLVKDSTIAAIGYSDVVQLPAGTQVIDGDGAYLMPGLADMHMHTRQDWDDQDIWPVHPLNLFLANGITTIRDFAPQGSPLTYTLQWRDEIQAGTRPGPTIYTSGILLYESPLGDPEGIVHQNYDMGFDFLKLYSYLSQDDFHEAINTAKTLKMYTTGHIPFPVGLDQVLVEGMDEIAHVEELMPEFLEFDRDKELTSEEWLPYIVETALQEFDISLSYSQADFETQNNETLLHVIEQLQSANVSVCTTMVIDDVIQLKLFQPEVFLERPENKYFEKGYLENFHQGEEKHQVQFEGIEELAAFKYSIDQWLLTELYNAGIQLLLGTDAGTGGMGIVPGYSVHDELHILVGKGFSPYEAIATGTINASDVIEKMTGNGDIGTIEVGKRADLILVRGNPLEDVGNIREPFGVMASGRWYSKERLTQMILIP